MYNDKLLSIVKYYLNFLALLDFDNYFLSERRRLSQTTLKSDFLFYFKK